METKNVLAIIFSILFVVAFGFVLSWGIINFNKVKDGMSGTGVYTQEDINKSYDDGYNTALADKEEYTNLINGYRDTITTLNDNISQLNSQITVLQNNNKDYQTQVDNLTTQKANLQTEINNLNENKTQNEKTISNLNSEITSLNNQITTLNSTISANKQTINDLNNQITSLNTQKESLNGTITTNEKTISDLRIEINDLNSQIVELSNDKTTNESTIKTLNNKVETLNSQINSLTKQNEEYVSTISTLNAKITNLTNEKNDLITENTTYSNTISSLNNQILNLQNVNTQLENTNTLHQNTIASLNTQIASLNEQIANMNLSTQDSQNQINILNNKINELQKSVTYYESYIANLESGEQVVATFEYDGSVYNIQIVNKGSTLSVATPTSTTYKIFNGWKVGNETIDLSTYTITTNTKIVADITYKYDVVFKVGDTTYNSQIVTSGTSATVPTNPTKDGYEFDGWSLDGTNLVNVTTNNITSNTTYVAVFTKLHTVTFTYEDTTKSTQTIRNGSLATAPTIDSTTYKVFNGWKVNNVIVDLSTYKITADTQFVADITYKYDVKFMVDNAVHNTQVVTQNTYPTLPSNPSKDGYEFDGWSINGTDIVNTTTIAITNTTTYKAVFTKLHTVTFVYENATKSTQSIRNGNYATNVAVDNTTYKVFNGWKVNNVIVDLSTYKITTDTQFVADITYKYDVKFMVDNAVHNTQVVTQNTYPTLPSNPTKDGYEFDGWSINGTDIVNTTTIAITSTTTYKAVFTKLHTVTFVYENETKSTQTIRNGSIATALTIESTTYKVFNGWKVNDTIVDVETYKIYSNTTFVANISYKYDVVFKVGDTTYNSQIVTSGTSATVPTNPTKDGYEFDGWSLDGTNLVNVTTNNITSNTTYVAVFTKLHTVTFVYEDTTKSTQSIRNGNYATNVAVDNTTYKVFNGWKVNNVIVDLSTYKIIADTQFVADITYKYDVKFMVDDTVYNTQIVTKNAYPTLPTNPTKDGYIFNGWKTNSTIVDVSSYIITQNLIFTADFIVRSTVTLSKSNFWNAFISTYSTVTNIVFDYYTNDNQYVVNGINVIDGISSLSLDNENQISLYKNGTNYYILSNGKIVLDSGERFFQEFLNLRTVVFNNLNTSNITDMSYMFYNCKRLTSLDLSLFDTSKAITMRNMFQNCCSLTFLNLSSFDTSKVTRMDSMFYCCEKLSSLNLSNFNTNNVTTMDSMFCGCSLLSELNLSSFDTSKLTDMGNMFTNCTMLSELDLSSFNTNIVTNMQEIFRDCSSLITIYVGKNFSISSNVISSDVDMFTGCIKLVGAISYDENKTDSTYANYTTGYFTYKAKA